MINSAIIAKCALQRTRLNEYTAHVTEQKVDGKLSRTRVFMIFTNVR